MRDSIPIAVSITGEERSGGRSHRTRGGAVPATVTAIKAELNKLATLGGKVDAAIASAIPTVSSGLGTGALVGTAVVTLNHPTVFGNLTQLVSEVLSTGGDVAITSTWGQWGETLLGMAYSLQKIGLFAARQSVQGPVVPVTIATAIMMARARSQGITLTKLVEKDMMGLSSTVADIANDFKKGQTIGANEKAVAQLRTLAMIAKDAAEKSRAGEAGQGAQAMSTGFSINAAPSAEGTLAGIGSVPAKKAQNYKSAAEKAAQMGPKGTAAAASSAPRSAASAFLAKRVPRTGVSQTERLRMAPGLPDADGDVGMSGGRRSRTRKGKKGKRRVTRRRPAPMPTFAY